MQLWETTSGDKWLCADCLNTLAETIRKENWQLIFDRIDPELRCANCSCGDVDVDD